MFTKRIINKAGPPHPERFPGFLHGAKFQQFAQFLIG